MGIDNLDQSQTSESLNNVAGYDKYRDQVIKILKADADIFVQKDSVLIHTDTDKMKMKTGDNHSPSHNPINIPYIFEQKKSNLW